MIHHTPFYFVRHGQTDWNLQRKLQGNTDVPLNQTGTQQAHEAKEKLKGRQISAIFSSPLKRARKTADIINQALDCPVFEIDGLRECNFGIHEGTLTHDWLADWLSGDDTTTPPEVEPFNHFKTRGLSAINQAISNPGPVLIVAHGGIYIPINQLLGKSETMALPNCQPVRLDPPGQNGPQWQELYL